MKRDQERRELFNVLSDSFAQDARKFGVEAAFLYGSWARGFPRADSDADVAIVFEPSVSRRSIAETSCQLATKLSIVAHREVAVLVIQPDTWKPMLYYNAIVLGKPLFVRDRISCFKLRHRAIGEAEEFGRIGVGWQLRAAHILLERLSHV